MAKYLSNILKPTQTEPLTEDQVKNNAGGYVFQLPPLKQLERFLILGSESNTYYCTARNLTKENAKCVLKAAEETPAGAVHTIVEISKAGRAPKNDPAIFALAIIAAQSKNDKARQYAFDAITDVCRIGTHLFQFVSYYTAMRGWGRRLRKAVSSYYTRSNDPKASIGRLAYDMLKYQSREGWSQTDILRSAHPKILAAQDLFKFVAKGQYSSSLDGTIVEGFKNIKGVTDPKTAARIIRDFGLTREMIPTELLNSKEVWEALLLHMPITAILRNLNKMTSIGLLTDNGDHTMFVMLQMLNEDILKKGRVHPLQILNTMFTYKAGQGQKGSLTWKPLDQINQALEQAYYKSFGAVEPANKRFMISLDVSGSMGMGAIGGIVGFTPALGTACLSMVTARTEPFCIVRGFTDKFVDLGITAADNLNTAMLKVQDNNFGGTDTSLPLKWATKNKIPVDCFITMTDNETYMGDTHTSVELEAYRNKMGIKAASVVVGMTSTGFTIADPSDEKSVDIVGFDTTAPEIIRWAATS